MTEEEKFEYGEEVLVRDNDTQKWEKRCYLMTAPAGRLRYLTVHPNRMMDNVVAIGAWIYPYAQIRKIQKPDTTKQRIDSFEAKINAILERYNKGMESIRKKLEEDND